MRGISAQFSLLTLHLEVAWVYINYERLIAKLRGRCLLFIVYCLLFIVYCFKGCDR
jgi:uncharacterized membrane protein YqjE